MREIRFRAWDKTAKRMVYNIQNIFDTLYRDEFGISDDDFYNLEIQTNESFGTVLIDENAVVMQSTGLKDSRDIEIYEGDILDDQFHCNQHYYIKWIDDKAGFYGKKIVKQPDDFGFGKPDYQLCKDTCLKEIVIGNIYEHPHLLNRR